MLPAQYKILLLYQKLMKFNKLPKTLVATVYDLIKIKRKMDYYLGFCIKYLFYTFTNK